MTRRIPWVIVYTGPERPCDFCAPTGSHKRAIFYHRRRLHHLCAKCMVALIENHAVARP